MQPKVSIVLCAGGKSSRFQSAGGKASKQFVSWSGRPLFLHTLDRFRELALQEAALVVPQSDFLEFQSRLRDENFPFELKLVKGGPRRQDSVREGLMALSPCEYVGIHDAARPFVSQALIQRLLSEVQIKASVIPVLQLVETVKELDAEGKIVRSLNRNSIYRVQTPQFFRYQDAVEVHRHWAQSDREFTDDAMMFEALNKPVFGCLGEPSNVKITVPEDLKLAGIRADDEF